MFDSSSLPLQTAHPILDPGSAGCVRMRVPLTNPASLTEKNLVGAVAQLGERLGRIEEVVSSTLIRSIC